LIYLRLSAPTKSSSHEAIRAQPQQSILIFGKGHARIQVFTVAFVRPIGRGAVMEKEFSSMDVVVLGVGILFFVLSLAYTKACDNL
jgi:hypothetical protein